MDSNKERKSISGKKLFLVIYICVFGFKVLFDLISEFGSGGEDLSVFWMVIIIDAVVSFLFVSPFLAMIKGVKSADKKVKVESMSKIDFVSSKEYYRDILKKYSPAELSYIDDFNIDYPKDIITTLLSLKLKNKITVINNFVNVIDFNDVGLRKTEKYILGCIKDGKVRLKHSHDIMQYAEEEAFEDALLIKTNKNNNKSGFKTFFIIIVFVVFFYLFCMNGESLVIFLENSKVPGNVIFILFFMIAIFFFGMFTFGLNFIITKNIMYSALKQNSYSRSDIGEQINKKIEGLKNYIKDFSILDVREQQELMIWEDYLIYSVLFNQNKKIFDELSCLVEAEYEVGKVYFETVDKNSSSNN